MIRAVVTFAADNGRLVLFVAGATWLYVGMAGFSVHAADVVAGLALMALGAAPYLQRKRKS